MEIEKMLDASSEKSPKVLTSHYTVQEAVNEELTKKDNSDLEIKQEQKTSVPKTELPEPN